ncbi:MAG: putative head completion protein [Prokaryotic dsDNA virus sp.]|mgnify:CR=1 FL=1|nr:MAG: putative head completion protein [Prokaryotic dsDNA virus sp.]|tara:strand:- start:5959 stop:6303 length:345 start_codon:yes stop_codon:yes gene_type:complete
MAGHVLQNIGKLKFLVELQSATTTSDGAGGVTEAYSKIADIWCDIQPISAIEEYRQGKLKEKVTHKLIMRYRSDINTSYKIVYGSREFNIRGILDLGNRNRFLEVKVEEGVAHG